MRGNRIGIICVGGVILGIMSHAYAVYAEEESIPPIVQVSTLAYSYDLMMENLNALKERYPGMIELNSRAETADGREIVEVILGSREAVHHILIQASIHGREHMNTVLAMNQIEDYLRGYYERRYNGVLWSDLYQDVCIHVIPMSNPDGVMISQQGADAVRDEELKQNLLQCYNRDLADGTFSGDQERYFRQWKANAKGVDLNRNFDEEWDSYIGRTRPSSERYKGDSAASEEETRAILGVLKDFELDCCISYHSYGNLIYWNYGSQGEVYEADRRLAECVSAATSYELHSTVRDSTDSAGCSDYFVLKEGIPAVTIENGGQDCPLPIEEYQPIYMRNQNLWPALAEFCKEQTELL